VAGELGLVAGAVALVGAGGGIRRAHEGQVTDRSLPVRRGSRGRPRCWCGAHP
jgi:hypothetical protein